MARKLYTCVVNNHPWAKRGHYYEEENGEVQEIKLRQDGVFAKPDGYVGIMFPFKELKDACIEIMPNDAQTAGILPSRIEHN